MACVFSVVWSLWVALEFALREPVLPAESGLYRIRGRGDDRLAYIGQTGRSLRERVRALGGVYRPEMPYRDPHTAGPALWAWSRAADVHLEVSVGALDASPAFRKTAEAVAIAEHRQLHGCSPRWNFGRMPVGYRMSSANNARLAAAGRRLRGGPCDESLPEHAAGIAPVGRLDDDFDGDSWFGLSWTSWADLRGSPGSLDAAAIGLYRIRGSTGLAYIGEGRIGARLAAHARKLVTSTQQGLVLAAEAPLQYSMCVDAPWSTRQRLELETDLIAAYALATGRPPAAQFLG